MTTRDLGISLHEELDRREALIAQLTQEAEVFRKAIELIERPTPQQHNRVTNVVGRQGRKASGVSSDTGKRCDKHPASEMTAKGCKACKAEYMKAYHAKKKAEKEKPKPNGGAIVRCPVCRDEFPDARAMGIHQTRVHFGSESLTRSNAAF